MDAFGWNRPRFMPAAGAGWGAVPHRHRSMGQTDTEWTERAQAAVGKFGALQKRVPEIADAKARTDIQDWVGRADVPGTPAERYRGVSEDLAAKVSWSSITTKRLLDLEAAVGEFEKMVTDAEKTYGTSNPVVQTVPTASPEGALTGVGFALGMAGILGLLVVPLLVQTE